MFNLERNLTDRSSKSFSHHRAKPGFFQPVKSVLTRGLGIPALISWSSIRPLFLLVSFTAVLSVSRFTAYQLRFDADVPFPLSLQLKSHWFWLIGVKLLFLALFGQF